MVEVGLALAFVAGVATFASPCCLPMVPVWIGYIVGGTPAGQRTNRLVALQQSLAFVVGFAVVFVGLWASIGLVGYLLRGYVDVIRQVAGVLLIVMGLHVAGLITIPFLRNQVSLGGRLVRRDASGAVVATRPRVLRSALVGGVFAAGWAPCVGPTLGAIIGMASLNDTFGQGTLLLVVFALGLGLPFVLVALGADAVRQRLAWLTNHQVIVSVVTGALLMVVGFLMLTNLFARLAQFTPPFPV